MPLPVLTVAQMRQWENETWASGQTEADVIRQVGHAVARSAQSLTRSADRILILAGKGHNGDDARQARQFLAERSITILDVDDPAARLADLRRELARMPALVVDGLFGIGLNRPLAREWVRFIEALNEADRPVLAVDVPSGLDAETGRAQGAAVRARVTLTVGAPKRGMLASTAWDYVGRLEAAHTVGLLPCSIPSDLQWTLPEDFRSFPPPREAAGHKGTYGHVGIIAGSSGFHGAAVLAARGAQRAQPGLVTLHALENIYYPVAAQLQAVMVSPWSTFPNTEKYSAILAGPGLAGKDVPDETKGAVEKLWRESPNPMVVDASALAWIPVTAALPGIRVITPHPGEAARLLGTMSDAVQSDRVGALRELSRKHGDCWVVLKGHQTLIGRSVGEVFVNSSGNPHLAQGGSGDLLSGYLAGFLAQPRLRSAAQTAIRYAAWSHGESADDLQAKYENWVVEDLIENLGSTSVSRC
ncbi:MAG TPA: NAD(P)H-hydrate dehydratase [Verrucomicrobiae bacterium]|nr:NAD(P)H-hydrate dehydratase [Verrucomicrobiae bacterium]